MYAGYFFSTLKLLLPEVSFYEESRAVLLTDSTASRLMGETQWSRHCTKAPVEREGSGVGSALCHI